MKEILAQNLRKAREHKRLSQGELANLVGVNLKTIQRWEAGQNAPTVVDVDRLAKALEVPLSMLVYGEGDPAKNVVSIMSQLILRMRAGVATQEEQDQLFRLAVQHLTGPQSLTSPYDPSSGVLAAVEAPEAQLTLPEYLRKLLEELPPLNAA